MKLKISIDINNKYQVTPRGYTYLLLSYQGKERMCKCDNCNKRMRQAYLVFAAHSCLCSKCFNEWLLHSQTYSQRTVDYVLQSQQRLQDEWYKLAICRMVIHDKGFYS